MLWLIVTISAYFLSAIVALFDKYLLKGPIPGPKIYSFYVGILGIFSLVLIPLGFIIPPPPQIFLSILAGALYIFSLSVFLKAVKLFEVSRVVPSVGAMTPFFVLGLTFLSAKQILSFYQFLAFFFLLFGGFLINWEKEKKINLNCLWLSLIAAFLFSLAFFFSKFVYLAQPFWSGFIWMRIGGFLGALFFLFSKEVKEELFKKRISFSPRIGGILILGQLIGGSGFILQNFAIKLVPLNLFAFVNALEGTKYTFLLIFTIFLSLKFPQILKEEITRKIIFQKIVAILFIGGGLALLAFK